MQNPIALNVQMTQEGRVTLPSINPLQPGARLHYYSESGTELIPIQLDFQGTIDYPPQSKEEIWKQAASNDKSTIDHWIPSWLTEFRENKKRFDFNENSVMKLFKKEAYKPIICAGSGPSLKKNAYLLNKHTIERSSPFDQSREIVQGGGRGDIKIITGTHNFGFLEDLEIMTENDYYMTLDAGPITISELTEGGLKYKPEEYWERTKNRTLISTIYGNHELLAKWKGPIYFFHTSWSEDTTKKEIFDTKAVDYRKVPVFATGGNVLGACFYCSRTILGASSTIMIGADFSFGYDRKFHSWDSGYDAKFQGVIPCTDIFGNRVFTWPSYYNFKLWFDFVAMQGNSGLNHLMINATEGGILGAYPNGNIRNIIQMDLKSALKMFTIHESLPEYVEKAGELPLVLF